MWHFIILSLIALVIGYYKYGREKVDVNVSMGDAGLQDENVVPQINEGNNMEEQEKPMTKELVCDVLKEIGCLPNETDENRIWFDYQGITFLLEAVDECLFVNLIWPWCHSCSLYDVDEFARVRKVINEINNRSTCTVFYVPNPESDEVAVHIKKNFLFVPQISQLDNYLKCIINGFFVTARNLDVEIEKIKMLDCEK
jgi:hypothetical protein